MKVALDCTITFKATCSAGCRWEGTGNLHIKDLNEINFMFTKVGTGEIPITAIGVMKKF